VGLQLQCTTNFILFSLRHLSVLPLHSHNGCKAVRRSAIFLHPTRAHNPEGEGCYLRVSPRRFCQRWTQIARVSFQTAVWTVALPRKQSIYDWVSSDADCGSRTTTASLSSRAVRLVPILLWDMQIRALQVSSLPSWRLELYTTRQLLSKSATSMPLSLKLLSRSSSNPITECHLMMQPPPNFSKASTESSMATRRSWASRSILPEMWVFHDLLQ